MQQNDKTIISDKILFKVLENINQYLESKKVLGEQTVNDSISAYESVFPFLWYYAKWLSLTASEKAPSAISAKETKSIYNWFNATIKLIHDWHANKELRENEINDFEKLIALCQYFLHIQNNLPINQDALNPIAITTTNSKELKKEYAIGSLFTLEQFKQFLKTSNLVQNGKLTLIKAYYSAVPIFKDGDYYHTYSGYIGANESPTMSLDAIAEAIFTLNEYKNTNSYPICLEIFSFDPEQMPYPSPTYILDAIKPTLVAENLFKYSGLEAAARVGSVESLQYFLARLIACDNQNLLMQNSMAAFIAAAENGHIEIVKWFLKNQKLDVNSHVNHGCTALILASENGKIDIVKLLLSNENIKVNMQTEWGKTALMNAARNGHVDIVKELLTNKNIDINLKDEHSRTALNMALEKNSKKLLACYWQDQRLILVPAQYY